jgi:hypothetical protein
MAKVNLNCQSVWLCADERKRASGRILGETHRSLRWLIETQHDQAHRVNRVKHDQARRVNLLGSHPEPFFAITIFNTFSGGIIVPTQALFERWKNQRIGRANPSIG